MLQFAIHTGIACSTTTEIQNSIYSLVGIVFGQNSEVSTSLNKKLLIKVTFVLFLNFWILAYCVEGCQKCATWARFWILVSTTDS